MVATLPDDVGVLSGGPLEGEYKILQLHFHWGSNDTLGSEHTLQGERSASLLPDIAIDHVTIVTIKL